MQHVNKITINNNIGNYNSTNGFLKKKKLMYNYRAN